MLPPRLHPFSEDRPDPHLGADVFPPGVSRLARMGGCQDLKLQRQLRTGLGARLAYCSERVRDSWVVNGFVVSASDNMTINPFTPQDMTWSTPDTYTFDVGNANRIVVSGNGAGGGGSYHDAPIRGACGAGGTGNSGADGQNGRTGINGGHGGGRGTSFESHGAPGPRWRLSTLQAEGGAGGIGVGYEGTRSAGGAGGAAGQNDESSGYYGPYSVSSGDAGWGGEESGLQEFTTVPQDTVLTVIVGSGGDGGAGGGGGHGRENNGSGNAGSGQHGAAGLAGPGGWIRIRTEHSTFTLASFDDTGLTMEMLALIEVGSEGIDSSNPAALYTAPGFMNPDAVPVSGTLF